MINYRDKLERSVSLIPAAAALSAEDRAALVKALETLVGQHSNKLESPELKKRIEALTEMQRQLKDLETEFFVERAALKAKQKRFQEEGHDFRLYTLKNNEVLAKEITEHDEEAFKYLSDINCCRIGSSNGFKMEFIFNPNPYFENSVLKKTYHMTNDNKPILEKAIGTEIKWYPGEIFAENCRSFFNFFQPLQAADVQSQMHRSYGIFSTIRDEIIPQWHQVNGKKNSHNSYNYGGHQEPLEIIFLGERAVLEGKYQKLYEPLYEKRYEIVNGITEVQETKSETAVDQEGGKATEEKGVPYFWVTAMKNDEVLGQKVTKSDDGALKYLKEIKWCRIDNSKGFKLEFFFDPNPYFKNTVLTKAYHMSSDSQMLEKTTGTNINWHPGKSLTPRPCLFRGIGRDWTGLSSPTDIIPCLATTGTQLMRLQSPQKPALTFFHSDVKNHRTVEAKISLFDSSLQLRGFLCYCSLGSPSISSAGSIFHSPLQSPQFSASQNTEIQR